MATVTASSWAEAFIPGLYNFFEVGFNVRPPLYPMLYDVQGSMLSKEEFVGIGGMSTDAWEAYEEGNSGDHGTANLDRGYTTTLTPKEYVVDFSVERKAEDDDRYGKRNGDATVHPQRSLWHRPLALSLVSSPERHGDLHEPRH